MVGWLLMWCLGRIVLLDVLWLLLRLQFQALSLYRCLSQFQILHRVRFRTPLQYHSQGQLHNLVLLQCLCRILFQLQVLILFQVLFQCLLLCRSLFLHLSRCLYHLQLQCLSQFLPLHQVHLLYLVLFRSQPL